ncbi:MAG: hypothetical protein JXM70_27340 [Pirellulales bacterium]|nr:hypothetical protein [Pirellulales bacterium]
MIRFFSFKLILVFGLLIVLGGTNDSTSVWAVEVVVDVEAASRPVSERLWGVFYEDINHAADGGLYAELVRNRSFEDHVVAPRCRRQDGKISSPTGWNVLTGDCLKPHAGWRLLQQDGDKATFAVVSKSPLNQHSPHSGKLSVEKIAGARVGIVNDGYWGMAVKKGARYRLKLFARAKDFQGTLTASLEGPGGGEYAKVALDKVGPKWQPLEAVVCSRGTAQDARLVLSVDAPGTLWFDHVSLLPEKTWRERPGILRPDLAEMLNHLRPAFFRFPGGCIVEGFSLQTAWRWKETIGPVERRPGRHNLWGYRATEGLGYHEYLELSEQLGAEPMFIINCGMTCQARKEECVPLDELGPWIEDALDAIEYANGPVESEWGGRRAANGHPEPFGLKMLGIGNENWGASYHERYKKFYSAIKKRYPQMELIATENVPGAAVDIIDHHYYRTPDWFASHVKLYDSADRKGPKIFVGEYAANRKAGKGNLRAALGEASFMIGLERNSDIVVMAAYAPLFVNVHDRRWPVDLIGFDNSRCYGTPSYYVQKLFAHSRPDRTVVVSVTGAEPETQKAGARMHRFGDMEYFDRVQGCNCNAWG